MGEGWKPSLLGQRNNFSTLIKSVCMGWRRCARDWLQTPCLPTKNVEMGIASGRKFRWTRQLIFHHRYFWCLLPLLAILLAEIFHLSVMSLNFFHRILLSPLIANSKHILLKKNTYSWSLRRIFLNCHKTVLHITTNRTLSGQLQYKSFVILSILGILLLSELSYCIGMPCPSSLLVYSSIP